MKKKLLLILLLIMMAPMCVFADELEMTTDAVGIRREPSTKDGTLIVRQNKGYRLPLVTSEKVADGGGCSSGWYKVKYNNQDAYVCSEYSRIIVVNNTPVDTSSCEAEMKSKGFPDAYVSKICVLKAKYPAWTFNPVFTGLDFKTAVEKESACGKNSISTSNAEYKDLSCVKNFDSGYAAVSQTAVANFMNPLNYINESQVFMFENNYVNPNVTDESYCSIVPNILSSFMLTSLPTLKDAINNAARSKNVSQVLLSARIKQEIGTGKATSNTYAGGLLSCICGEYTKRWGTLLDGKSLDYYYNFFNIGVYDGSNGDAAYRAVTYAAKAGWGGTGNQIEDLTKAIGGGADFLKNRYLDQGQNTIYFQKFNVHPKNTSSLYINQYMSNIQAPVSEASIVYKAYSNSNMLNNAFVFEIPVFNNLDATINNSSNGANNDTTENTSSGMDVGTMVVSSGFKLDNTTISSVELGMSIDEFKNKINSLGGTVTGGDTGLIGTGKKVKISNGSVEKEFTFIVKGDTSGDGVINALDLAQVQKSILGSYKLDGVYKTAGDPSGDGTVNALDLAQIQKAILGTYKINQ